jgi:hypothetical protein
MSYARIANEYAPELGAIATQSFIAALGMVFGFGTADHTVQYITRSSASVFLVVAAFLVWGIVRFERRQYSGGYREQ